MKLRRKIVGISLLITFFLFFLMQSFVATAATTGGGSTSSKSTSTSSKSSTTTAASKLSPYSGSFKSDATKASTDTKAIKSQSGGGGGGEDSGWLSGLISSIKELVDNIKKIMTGEAIKEFFLNWIADWMQEILNMWLKVLGFAFVKIPTFVQQGNWIHSSWGAVLWCTIPFLMLGIMVNAYRIMRGIRIDQAKSVLWVLSLSMLFSFYSLTLFDYGIKICNFILSQSLTDTFSQINAHLSSAKSQQLQGFKVSFDNMSGEQAIYLILVGPDGDQTLMRSLLKICGLWFSQIQGLLLLVLSISTLLMYGVIIALAIFSPFWSSWSALSGRPEPMIGWGHLIFRCFVIKFIYSFSWQWMADRQLEKPASDAVLDLVSAPALNTIVIIVLLIVTWFIYWRPVLQAAAHPVYLNGASVLKNVSNSTKKASGVLKQVASNFGIPISKDNDDMFSKMVNKLDDFSESSGKRAEKWMEKGDKLKPRNNDSLWEKIVGKSPIDGSSFSYTNKMGKVQPSFTTETRQLDMTLQDGYTLSGDYRVFETQHNVHEIENRIVEHNKKLLTPIENENKSLKKKKEDLSQIEEQQKMAQEELKGVTEQMKVTKEPDSMQVMVAHRDYLTKQMNELYEKKRSLQEEIQSKENSISSLKKEMEAKKIVYQKDENGSIHAFVEKGDEQKEKEVQKLFTQSTNVDRPRFWTTTDGGYVVIEKGVPMKTSNKPKDGVEMGLWKA